MRIDRAERYVRSGFPCIPLCWPVNGECGCGKGHEDKNIGKAPLTRNGLTDAATTVEQAKAYWTKWPDANIGVVIPDGYFVLDIDIAHNGYESLQRLQEVSGLLPKTLQITTGTGGAHFWYKTDVPIRNTVKLAGYEGLDIRGKGGYVVAPPSEHRCGGIYYKSNVWDGPITEAPQFLIDLCTAKPIVNNIPSPELPISDGERNDTLARIAGGMRRNGLGEEAIYTALSITNRDRCVPPLPDRDIQTIARSINRYPPEPHKTNARYRDYD